MPKRNPQERVRVTNGHLTFRMHPDTAKRYVAANPGASIDGERPATAETEEVETKEVTEVEDKQVAEAPATKQRTRRTKKADD
jgi:hypothetical protein